MTSLLNHTSRSLRRASRPGVAARWASLAVAGSMLLPLFGFACAQDPSVADPAAAPSQPAAATTQPAGESIYFGPRFDPGKVSVYEFKAINNSSQRQGDMDMNNDTYTELVMRVAVNEVDAEGSASLSMTYDRVYMTGDSMLGGSFVYDSNNPGAPETDRSVANALNKLKNSVFTFKVDKAGEVLVDTLTGFEEAEAAIKNVDTLRGRENEFNRTGLPDVFESMWRVGNTSTDRSVGEQWQEVQSTPVEGIGTWTFTSDFNVQSADSQKAVIGMAMTIDLEFKPPEEMIEGMLTVRRTEFETIVGNWRYEWDRTRSEVLSRQNELEFEWLIEQDALFEGEALVRTVQHQHVQTTLKRIGTEKDPAPEPAVPATTVGTDTPAGDDAVVPAVVLPAGGTAIPATQEQESTDEGSEGDEHGGQH